MISGVEESGNENDDEKLVLSRLKEETGIDEDVIQQNIDKMHPIGQPEDGKQCRIVNFTGDKFKKTVFMKYKQQKKACIEKEKKKQLNQCQSGSAFNTYPSDVIWNYWHMPKKN